MEDLPEGWAETQLGAIGEYLNGRAFKSSEWGRRGRPIIRIQDLTGSRESPNYFSGQVEERYVVRLGDLLISWAATLGAYIWSGPEGVLNQHIFKVRSHIDKRFHYFLVRHLLDELQHETHGSGMVHITKGKFDSAACAIPPLAEQKRIVEKVEALLGQVQAARDRLERVQQILKRFRQSVLAAACEGRLSSSEQDSWRETTLGAVCREITVGHVGPMATEYVESGVSFLRSQNVRPFRFDPLGLKYVSRAFHQRLSKTALHPGDVVVVRSGNAGVACVVPNSLREANCADLVILRPSAELDPNFVVLFLNSNASRAHVDQVKVGIAQGHFNIGDARAMPILLPPIAEQQQIVARVTRLFEVATELEGRVKRAKKAQEAASTSHPREGLLWRAGADGSGIGAGGRAGVRVGGGAAGAGATGKGWCADSGFAPPKSRGAFRLSRQAVSAKKLPDGLLPTPPGGRAAPRQG